MDTDEFKSLPADFFRGETTRPDPKWILLLGVLCVGASVAAGVWLLLGF